MSCRIERITEGTWLIEEDPGSGAVVYMYLLAGQREALLIDTGYGSIPLRDVVSELTALPVTVLLTHGHLDHIGGSAGFDHVLLHKEDLECYRLHASEQERNLFGLDPGLPFPKEMPEPITGEWQMDLGERPIRLIHTPGHTPGSVCVLDINNRLLFTGDVCCRGNVLLNMRYSLSVQTYRDGLKRLMKESGAFDIIWPGHHEKPLSPEIIREFDAAAAELQAGGRKGEPVEIAGGKAMEMKYGTIGILYTPEGEEPVL